MKYFIMDGSFFQEKFERKIFIVEKIKRYIDRFFSKTRKNQNYAMRSGELFAFMNEIIDSRESNGAFVAATTLFDFGYAKGYRAAQAEMKKGSA